MKKIKRALLWFFLLEKRLFKKAGYLVLLIAVPVVALIMSLIASRSDGAIKVALFCGDPTDPAAVSIYDELVADSDLVGFREAGSREEAESLVRYGTVDMAWVIEGGVVDKLHEYVSGKNPSGPVYTVYVREDKPMLLLAREKLSAKMAPYMMREAMKEYIKKDLDMYEIPDDDALNEYYAEAFGKDGILAVAYTSSGDPMGEEVNYIVIPARGMLAVMIVLCGLAAATYYRRDVDASVFFPPRGFAALPFEVGYILTGIVPAAAVSAVSLAVAGVTSDPLREIASLLLFCLTTALFCTLIMRIVVSGRLLAVLTPVVVIGLFAISPIFFDFGTLKAVQALTPTYHYLLSTYNPSYFLSSALYVLVAAVLCEAVRLVKAIPERVRSRRTAV